jgi:hypothetical protein
MKITINEKMVRMIAIPNQANQEIEIGIDH